MKNRYAIPTLVAARARLALAAVAALVAGCGAGSEELSVTAELAPSPPRVGPVTATLRLADPAGRAVQDAAVRVEANMNHAGMVPVFSDARETAPGVYEADFEFTMAGDWFLLVTAKGSGGTVLEGVVDLPGVARADAVEGATE